MAGVVLIASMMGLLGANDSRRRVAGLGVDGLDVELDVDAIADEHPAGFEHLVPLEAEVLAIDRRLRDEADALVAPWIQAAASGLDVERDRARDVADGELAN